MNALATRLALAATAALFGSGATHGADAPAPAAEWNFRVLLNGKPIGTHRFEVTTHGDTARKVVSDANFTVKVLGLAVYRYRHHAAEHWRGECLAALTSMTDDDGKASKVELESASAPLHGCAMSFAYWNPSIRAQTRLLNAQTGEIERVLVSRIGSGTVEVRGRPVAATKYRISGPAAPIDVWYSIDDEWIGLDSTVAGGRLLSYRLP